MYFDLIIPFSNANWTVLAISISKRFISFKRSFRNFVNELGFITSSSGHIRIFGTVESNSIIIIWLSVAKFRLLNDVIWTMVDYFFHNVTFLFIQIILLEEYKESSANILPLQEYNFNRGCEKSELFTCIGGKGNRVFKQRKFCYNVNTQRRALHQMWDHSHHFRWWAIRLYQMIGIGNLWEEA